MALLLDGSWCEVNDLEDYDGGATTAAAEEGIDITVKMSLSEGWITDQVDTFLRWESGLTGDNAVVDAQLKRWQLSNVLAMLYRDAAFSQANDRFEKKWKAFEQDAGKRKAEYLLAGVPFVANPVRKPNVPVVVVTTGDEQAAAYSIAVTRVDGAGRESAPSKITAVQVAAGNGIIISTTGFGELDRWNVYASDSDSPLRKQNFEALNGTATWSLTHGGLSTGQPVGDGQLADGRIRQRRILPRG